MSDIISAANYIQNEEVDFESPTAESMLTRIGGSLNFLLDKTASSKVGYFVGAGTTPIVSGFVIPDDADLLYFWLLGGGGGGGGSDGQNTGNPTFSGLGGAGGCGAYHVDGLLPVTGGGTVTVSVGGGGTIGFGNTNGGTGDDTTISGAGVSQVARGNGGGERALDGGNNSFNQYQIGTGGGIGTTNPTAGFGSQAYIGGQPGGFSGNSYGGGGGGSSILAQGGAGGNGNQDGNAGTLGSGGGGSGGDLVGGFLDGGQGGAGLAILIAYKIG